jgi:hypothetical protein
MSAERFLLKPRADSVPKPASAQECLGLATQLASRLNDPCAVWAGRAIIQILQGDDARIVLRTKAGPGERSFATEQRLLKRDGLLKELAGMLSPTLSCIEKANLIKTRWERYAAGAWKRTDSFLSECPHPYLGTINALLFGLQQTSPRPLTSERIRRLIT